MPALGGTDSFFQGQPLLVQSTPSAEDPFPALPARSQGQSLGPAQGRIDPFCKSSTNNRYLRRLSDVSNRREADIMDRGAADSSARRRVPDATLSGCQSDRGVNDRSTSRSPTVQRSRPNGKIPPEAENSSRFAERPWSTQIKLFTSPGSARPRRNSSGRFVFARRQSTLAPRPRGNPNKLLKRAIEGRLGFIAKVRLALLWMYCGAADAP